MDEAFIRPKKGHSWTYPTAHAVGYVAPPTQAEWVEEFI